jgi:hypothetical protein
VIQGIWGILANFFERSLRKMTMRLLGTKPGLMKEKYSQIKPALPLWLTLLGGYTVVSGVNLYWFCLAGMGGIYITIELRKFLLQGSDSWDMESDFPTSQTASFQALFLYS